MNRFILKKLVVSGGNHEDSVVEFSKGLNLIVGPSNTGKSLIIDCIDYIFGFISKEGKPSKIEDNSNGYTKVSLTLDTPEGDVTFTRIIGSNKITVSSNNENIKSGEYSVKSGLNDIYLKLLGITGEHRVLSSQKGKTVRLTWRSILHLFLMKQEDIARASSALLGPHTLGTTASPAALLYLLTGKDFNDFETPEPPEITQAKKKAIMLYIRDKKDELSSRREKIQEELSKYDATGLKELIESIQESIKDIQEELNKAYEKSQSLLSEIYSQNNLLSECCTIISSFENLSQQYQADIQRYEFIIEGKKVLGGTEVVRHCPFCDSEIVHKPDHEQIKAAQVELQKLQFNLMDLGEAQEDAESRKTDIQNNISVLKKEKVKIDAIIANDLRPKAEKFQVDLESKLKILKLQQELEVIKQDEYRYSSDLLEKEKGDDSTPKAIKISDSYDIDLVESFNNELISVLEQCKIGGASSARLNMLSFEIVIGNHSKSTCMGGGYCALLNTLTVYAMNSCIYKNDGYAPGFFAIDSALTLLSEAEGVKETDSIKYNFLNFFINNSKDRQIIMIEQKDEMPFLPVSNESEQINVIKFTGDPSKGRYGFLNDVYNPGQKF